MRLIPILEFLSKVDDVRKYIYKFVDNNEIIFKNLPFVTGDYDKEKQSQNIYNVNTNNVNSNINNNVTNKPTNKNYMIKSSESNDMNIQNPFVSMTHQNNNSNNSNSNRNSNVMKTGNTNISNNNPSNRNTNCENNLINMGGNESNKAINNMNFSKPSIYNSENFNNPNNPNNSNNIMNNINSGFKTANARSTSSKVMPSFDYNLRNNNNGNSEHSQKSLNNININIINSNVGNIILNNPMNPMIEKENQLKNRNNEKKESLIDKKYLNKENNNNEGRSLKTSIKKSDNINANLEKYKMVDGLNYDDNTYNYNMNIKKGNQVYSSKESSSKKGRPASTSVFNQVKTNNLDINQSLNLKPKEKNIERKNTVNILLN